MGKERGMEKEGNGKGRKRKERERKGRTGKVVILLENIEIQ